MVSLPQQRWYRIPLIFIAAGFGTLLSAYGTFVILGLEQHHRLRDTFFFTLWTLPVSGTIMMSAACFTIIPPRRIPAAIYLAVIPLGLLHGLGWHAVVARTFEPTLASYPFSFRWPWIVGSITGLLLATAVAREIPPTFSDRWFVLFPMTSTVLFLIASCILLTSCLIALWAWDGDGTILHHVVNPDHQVTALVISDSCGATCSCQMRVDLRTAHRYIFEVYRSYQACDAQARWLTPTLLDIKDSAGGRQQIDITTLQLEQGGP